MERIAEYVASLRSNDGSSTTSGPDSASTPCSSEAPVWSDVDPAPRSLSASRSQRDDWDRDAGQSAWSHPEGPFPTPNNGLVLQRVTSSTLLGPNGTDPEGPHAAGDLESIASTHSSGSQGWPGTTAKFSLLLKEAQNVCPDCWAECSNPGALEMVRESNQ